MTNDNRLNPPVRKTATGNGRSIRDSPTADTLATTWCTTPNVARGSAKSEQEDLSSEGSSVDVVPMDPETLRMILSTGAGILGVLLGAGVTGWINLKNAKAAREAERAMWELRSSHDRDEARREEKRDVYVAYNTALHSITTLIGYGHLSDPRRLDEGPIFEVRRAMSEASQTMKLLPGTELVTASMTAAMQSQADLLTLVEESLNEGRELSEEDFAAACDDFQRKSAVTTLLMRRSLEKKLPPVEPTMAWIQEEQK
ncbi:hypothetical protein [Arthrobacter sp. NPDC058127]|uniref:hypothetical protein n=1 Tax=Arthrobacter sp. NPDC058127 TaxID=3346351 RepID=UPI0036EA1690